jgi:tripartite-type tricarboxylate transporter receptor subunit TctC
LLKASVLRPTPLSWSKKSRAEGNLAALVVLKAEPNRYTAFVTTNSTQAANISMFNSLLYDPKADFAPVAAILTIPMMLTVKGDFPAKSVADFVALARKREKPLSFGSGNTSSRGRPNYSNIVRASRCSMCRIAACHRL